MNKTEFADVLLVEDDPADLALALRTLKQAGLKDKIQIAHNGREALAFIFGSGADIHARPPHLPRLVLLDLKLPLSTGLRVLQWIRADPRTRDLPVAILTGHQDDAEVIEIYKLGVSEYFQKPLDLERFRQLAAKLGIVRPAEAPPLP